MVFNRNVFLILTPIIAMGILAFGNGFFTTYSSVELNSLGTSNFMIGIISSVYSIGLALGSYFSQFTIIRVGYIRAFVLFTSIICISTTMLGFFKAVPVWIVFRFASGYSLAALFLIIESWCILASDKKSRGLVFSAYLFTYYGAQSLSQLMMNVNFSSELAAYSFISILCSISIVFMASTKTVAPIPKAEKAGSIKEIIKKVPLAMIAAMVGGIAIGSVYTILPIFLVRVPDTKSIVSILMMITILGSMILQLPIGKLSDMVLDRRKVILLAGVGIILSAIGICIFYESIVLFAILIFIFGGFTFAVYPLAVSHASDFLDEDDMLGAIGVITISYGIGSAIGPIIISNSMDYFGAFGFFYVTIIVAVIFCLYTFYRLTIRQAASDTSQFTPVSPESVGFDEAREIVSNKLSEGED